MDTFLLLLSFLLLPLSLCLILFFHKTGSGNLKNLPPGSMGWPVFGENLELALLGFPKFVKDRMQKYSPDAFQTSVFGENIVVLCGAQGNRFVFRNDSKVIAPWYPPSLKKLIFPDFTNSKVFTPLFRNFQYDTLKLEAMKQYIPVMDSLAREQLEDGWRPNTMVKALPLIKKFTFALSSKLFLDVVDPDNVNKLSDPFTRMRNGLFCLPINFPGTTFNRAIKAGKILRGEMMKIVRERRKEMMENEGGERRDLLSKMLTLTDEDGKYVSDEKIANSFVALLVASYDTIASTLTCVIYYLAQLPHIYEEVFKEQMEIAKSKGPDEQLTWEDVQKMKYSRNVAHETLRLAPPGPGIFRKANAELNFAGFTIPKGWKVFSTVYSSHMNPEYFPEPEKFDPSRFEGRGPAPYTFVPFGGGATICPGREYAMFTIMVFMHNLVTRFRLEKAIPDEKMVVLISSKPAHDLLLHLHPHQE